MMSHFTLLDGDNVISTLTIRNFELSQLLRVAVTFLNCYKNDSNRIVTEHERTRWKNRGRVAAQICAFAKASSGVTASAAGSFRPNPGDLIVLLDITAIDQSPPLLGTFLSAHMINAAPMTDDQENSISQRRNLLDRSPVRIIYEHTDAGDYFRCRGRVKTLADLIISKMRDPSDTLESRANQQVQRREQRHGPRTRSVSKDHATALEQVRRQTISAIDRLASKGIPDKYVPLLLIYFARLRIPADKIVELMKATRSSLNVFNMRIFDDYDYELQDVLRILQEMCPVKAIVLSRHPSIKEYLGPICKSRGLERLIVLDESLRDGSAQGYIELADFQKYPHLEISHPLLWVQPCPCRTPPSRDYLGQAIFAHKVYERWNVSIRSLVGSFQTVQVLERRLRTSTGTLSAAQGLPSLRRDLATLLAVDFSPLFTPYSLTTPRRTRPRKNTSSTTLR
ncbi:hypothetical protein, variant 1 [Cladophialophora immunda]|uniref:Uncharacterized protein n=1 Tax=Cladophialophora immunda TaxID=569365 RepID=A0A0D2BSG8_9EURO|nr:hypothetical protein, variant 1 [Cladophialophora immunda]KIW21978.1 hypothetical protein, variant 1 [Cladophialophora immunda]